MKTTTNYKIFLGLLDQETRQQEIKTLDAFKVVSRLAAVDLGGATITDGSGVYTHDDGSVIEEPSLVISVLDLFADDKDEFREKVKAFRDKLQLYFNQESVLLIAEQTKAL